MDALPDLMTVMEIAAPGGPEVLRSAERRLPKPGRGEVLIRVRAAGVNRPDVLQRMGRYPPPPGASDIPGLEVAGEVVGLCAEDPPGRWQVGDRVCALVAGGGYATYAIAPSGQCLPVPDGLDVVKAAAIPEASFTVWSNLFERGRLDRGERVLIHGGASGIGTTAIQLARVSGAIVFATAGSDEKCAACVRLGADVAINYRRDDFEAVIAAETMRAGVNVILDIVGGDYLRRNLHCLAADGRLVQVGLMGSGRPEIDLGLVLQRRLTITGSTLRPRSLEEKSRLARAVEKHVWPWVADGTVQPVIDATFPLTGAADAHRRMESGDVIGKLVLVP